MSVYIRCTSCQKKLAIPDDGLGKKIRCPACQTVFVAAAESAITTAGPAPPPAATPVRSGPPPAPRGRERDDDDDLDERREPRRRRDEERRPFRPINLRVIVKTKTDAIKKGNYSAVLDEEGLLLKNRKGDIDIPVGTPTTYEGKNNLTVEIEGEPVKMQIARFRTYQNRFTEEVAAFLNKETSRVRIADFEIPWYMFILVMLPWGVPIITLGGLAPIVIGAGVSGANFAIISQENWSPGTRITIAAILTGLAYLAVILLVVFVIRIQLQGGRF